MRMDEKKNKKGGNGNSKTRQLSEGVPFIKKGTQRESGG